MDTARYIRITNLCMLFFRAEGIAFSLYDKQDTCHLQYPEEPQRNTAALFAGRDPARTLDICTTPSHAGYASIRIKGGWRIVIGPVYNARLNESLVDAFMAENQIPAAQRHAADTILEAAPNLSLLEFFDKAAYLYYCMDGEILDPSVYFDLTNDRDSFTVGRDAVENLLERKENEKFHNSYQWELMFYDLIRQGDPERLMAFLMQDSSTRLGHGTMADTPLRQAKNIFIGCMDDMFGMQYSISVENQPYPVLCTLSADGCTAHVPDFPKITTQATTLDAALLEVKQQIQKALRQYKNPPIPTKQDQIVVPNNSVLVLVKAS